MRTSILVVALMLAATGAVLASGQGEQVAADGSVLVDAFVMTTGEWPDYSPENNRLVAYFEDEFDVTFEFIATPEEGVAERKTLLLASGDYPSVFFHGMFSRPERQRYGRLGVLQPLNELIALHAPNITAAFADDPAYEEGLTAPDGNIYGLGGASLCYHCEYTPKLWMNYDWLETLGLEVPQTAEEFADVLRAFRDGDPNGNGEADEIPFSGMQQAWFGAPREVLLSPFSYVNISDYLHVEDGEVFMVATRPEFREGLIWANGLYEEGLIDPLAFTQDEDAFASVAQNPDAALVGAYPAGHQVMGFNIDNPDRWTQYFAVPPLEGPNGYRMATWRPASYGEAGFAVTDKASEEVAQVAIEMEDWVHTLEGGLSAMWGPRGEIWDWAEAGDLGMRGQPAVFRTDFAAMEPGVVYGFEPPFYLKMEDFMGWNQTQDIDQETGYERRLTLATDMYAEFTPDEVLPGSYWFSEEEADLYAQYQTDFNSYIDQNVVAFITGQQDIEGDWDEFQNGLRTLGLEAYVELVQNAYDQN